VGRKLRHHQETTKDTEVEVPMGNQGGSQAWAPHLEL